MNDQKKGTVAADRRLPHQLTAHHNAVEKRRRKNRAARKSRRTNRR